MTKLSNDTMTDASYILRILRSHLGTGQITCKWRKNEACA